jgi:plasmid stabilization system protein ParE
MNRRIQLTEVEQILDRNIELPGEDANDAAVLVSLGIAPSERLSRPRLKTPRLGRHTPVTSRDRAAIEAWIATVRAVGTEEQARELLACFDSARVALSAGTPPSTEIESFWAFVRGETVRMFREARVVI